MTDGLLSGSEWDELARTKVTKVLGPAEGESVMRSALAEVGLQHLESVDDLHRFSQVVIGRGGFAAAVGAMLALMATLRGASALSSSR